MIAAARIACGGALLGCPAASTTPPQATVEAASSGDAVRTDAPPAAPTSEALAACQQTTAAAFPKGEAKDGNVSAEVLACCQMIAADHDSRGLANLGDWAERSGCCSAMDWQGSAACTPWGPPTPPTMNA